MDPYTKWKNLLVFFKPKPTTTTIQLQDLNIKIQKQNLDHYSQDHPHSSQWTKTCTECALLERLKLFFHEVDDISLPMQIEPLPWGQHTKHIMLHTLLDIDPHKRRMSFFGENVNTMEQVFVKIQNVSYDTGDCYFKNKGLETEVAILHFVKGMPFVPRLLEHGVYLQSKYMVVQCLGPSLSTLKKNPWLSCAKDDHPLLKQAKIFIKSHDVALAAKQLVHRLQLIHKFDILHKDIKPDNICFGVGKHSNQVYLVDFETAWHPSFFGDDSNQTEHYIFTPYYASPYVSPGQYSPRDELISLGFVLMSMFAPLPWHKVENSLTHSECKYLDLSEQTWRIHQRRETIKREMFRQNKDGTIKFTGHQNLWLGTKSISLKKVLEKKSINMYPFFERYFDLVFNANDPKKATVYKALQDHCHQTHLQLQRDYFNHDMEGFAFGHLVFWIRCPYTGRFVIFYKKF